jgi:ribulose-phosphate 3-epimerase
MQQDKTKIEIIPTVMPENYDDFIEKINRVYRFVDDIQIDVMDGKFVPSASWPYNSKNDSEWQKILKQEEGIPHWQKCDFEIDLMVLNQIEEANNWIDAGVKRIIGHYKAFFVGRDEDSAKIELEKFLNLKTERGVEVYMALDPKTDNDVLNPFLDRLDGVQFMGIEKIGYQGQTFSEIVLEKIKNLRNVAPNLPIAVDGGVSFETAPLLIQAGATKLSSGSLIFGATNPKDIIDELKNLVQ